MGSIRLLRGLAAFLLVGTALSLGLAASAVQAAAKPPAPTNLRVTDVGWDEVELSWEAPSVELDWSWYYEITNVTTGQREFPGFWQTSDRPPWLPMLEPETSYTFEIRLVDPEGVRSAPSNRVTVTTLPVPHVEAPTNLRATAVYSFSAYFSWDAADEPGTRYRLTNLTTGSSSIHTGTTNVPHLLLRPGRSFSFEVAAIAESGVVSAPSNRVTITTPTVDPPADVVASLDGNDVTLSWTRPAYLDPARATTYFVYDRGALVAVATVRNADGDTVQVALPRVASGVTHQYTVRVRDWLHVAGNLSEPSDPAPVAVPPSADITAPTAPAAVIEVDSDTGISTFRITEQSTDDTSPQSEIRYEGLLTYAGELYAYHHDIPLQLAENAGIPFPERGIRAVDEAGNRSQRVVPTFVILD